MTAKPACSHFRFTLDSLEDHRVVALLMEHLHDMYAVSPPESVHALDLDGLRASNIRFWSAWSGEGAIDSDETQLIGTCALKDLGGGEAELKSMRVVASLRGSGAAQAILDHVINEAKNSGVQRISLETGTQPYFSPARRFYARNGFVDCAPFGDYVLDPHSCFMTLQLA